ncbi:hypothetical protein GWO60_00340 [Corynebacterium macginleyi]|uniref:ATP-grasp domain-containing protein n=1 Tax=Corynebacterium macginleyi TaxID=38290 RepID=A0ABS1Y584_9CORY|nr:hypothetical protein [Corynebacterium macginleyi]MBK4143962.1 hypothetical protein [Corynebacterium macginleyi]MBK4151445.1 hypothetical protein [Corynebacterium macginleyi]MBK4161594.1 hypothetical protein [Corynebacterium macginleyi]MBK4165964.1 hypothetical protein [Corynebacterium macginleyi]MBK4166954.1 hypothetical protein [Corynebacterium macginleyi]
MNIEGTCPLPVKPGMTVTQAIKACYDSELTADTYEEQFEGWVDIETLEPGDPGRKVVCCVEDGKCVTVEMKYMEAPITDTCYGVDLNRRPAETAQESTERIAKELQSQGIRTEINDFLILLPDQLVAIEVNECVAWFDPAHWSLEDFLDTSYLA